jgi:hypothetical protein
VEIGLPRGFPRAAIGAPEGSSNQKLEIFEENNTPANESAG